MIQDISQVARDQLAQLCTEVPLQWEADTGSG